VGSYICTLLWCERYTLIRKLFPFPYQPYDDHL